MPGGNGPADNLPAIQVRQGITVAGETAREVIRRHGAVDIQRGDRIGLVDPDIALVVIAQQGEIVRPQLHAVGGPAFPDADGVAVPKIDQLRAGIGRVGTNANAPAGIPWVLKSVLSGERLVAVQ